MLIHDLAINEMIIVWSMALGLFLIFVGTAVFVVSILIFVEGSIILESKGPKRIILISIIIGIFSFILLPEFISLDPIRLKKSIILLISMGVWSYYMLISTVFKINKTLDKISNDKKESKKKIKTIWWAVLVSIAVPTTSFLAGITQNQIFSMLQFLFLALSVGIIGLALRKKK